MTAVDARALADTLEAGGTITDVDADAWLLHVTAPKTCQHTPECPDATGPDRDAARVVWHDDNINASRLCNGVWIFGDTGELVPDDGPDGGPCHCHIAHPHRGPARHSLPKEN